MGFTCRLFGHKYERWYGCRCVRCGAEKPHDWRGCTCFFCGTKHDTDPDRCVCNICGQTVHRWTKGQSGCECRKCDEKKPHDFRGCTCSDCGQEHDLGKNCVCRICGAAFHDWDELKCRGCGFERRREYVTCPACDGQGFDPDTMSQQSGQGGANECSRCEGKGQVMGYSHE